MTTKIDLGHEAEAGLALEGSTHGLAKETSSGSLLQEIVFPVTDVSGKLTVGQYHAMLDALAEGSENLPSLPTASFTRESFYEDRA